MSDRTPEEEDLLERVGKGEGERASEPEGGGGVRGDESFTIGGPRRRNAEREEYDEPNEGDE